MITLQHIDKIRALSVMKQIFEVVLPYPFEQLDFYVVYPLEYSLLGRHLYIFECTKVHCV